jgi:hypothetical protein
MDIGTIIRRLLVYQLMRYRIAWLLFSLLGFYLAAIMLLLVSAQQQHTLSGAAHTCVQQRGDTLAFTLDGQSFATARSAFTPTLPANLCDQTSITVLYETNFFHDPPTLDAVQFTDPQTGTIHHYTRAGLLDFETAHRLQFILGGSLFSVSALMLLVALYWPRVGYLMQSGDSGPIPATFIAQVEDDIRWLDSLPWGVTSPMDAETAQEQFNRGLALVRGWLGDETRLLDGIEWLVRCPPSLAYTGAAEAALQCSACDVSRYVPQGTQYALRMVRRALALDPTSDDIRLTYVQALAALGAGNDPNAGRALRLAERELVALRGRCAAHPRLPVAVAAIYLAKRHYRPAIVALRAALAVAPTQLEANALLDLLAQTLLRAGNLREALRLFVLLNLDGDESFLRLPAARRRHALHARVY